MRIKAKTSPTGYIVIMAAGRDIVEYPVARFDDEGWAMICDLDGKLVRAAGKPEFQSAVPMSQVTR